MMLSGGRIKKSETNIDSLPDELCFDILIRLQADFLHDIAKLVCRRWCHIIRSHAFVSTHIQLHSTYGLVLPLTSRDPHAIYVTVTQGRIETSKWSSRKIIATSCNGLALERNADTLHVTNPATKQSFLLPYSEHNRNTYVYYHLSGIAYSAASMEYKVTLPYKDLHHITCLDIVTLGVDKSWRHVEIPLSLERFRSFFCSISPLSREGFLHWGNGRYCLTLNVETEIMTLTEAPISPPYSYYYLSTGRYITLLASHKKLSWEVWEMRPAESGEWRKALLPDIDLEPQKCKLQQQFGYDDHKHYLRPVGWVKYPEVLALRFGSLVRIYIFYNLETHEINKRPIVLASDHYDHQYRALVHRNSLVWLAQD